MTTVSLGKVAFRWRSTYNAATTYMRQDVVAYLGSTFVCVADNTVGVTPNDAHVSWDLFAQGTTGVSTSSGQILYNNGSGLVALAAGTVGQVLTVGAGGLPVLIPVFTAGGGGGTFLLGCKAGFIFCAAGGLAAKRVSF